MFSPRDSARSFRLFGDDNVCNASAVYRPRIRGLAQRDRPKVGVAIDDPGDVRTCREVARLDGSRSTRPQKLALVQDNSQGNDLSKDKPFGGETLSTYLQRPRDRE